MKGKVSLNLIFCAAEEIWEALALSPCFSDGESYTIQMFTGGVSAELFLRYCWAASQAEKLKAELAESRISIMLSQIQPNFLYNCLNSIYHLCEKNPKAAKTAVIRIPRN